MKESPRNFSYGLDKYRAINKSGSQTMCRIAAKNRKKDIFGGMIRMKITKKAIIAISFLILLAMVITTPAVCAQFVTIVSLSPEPETARFEFPEGIAIDSADNIYVTTANSRISKFSPSGDMTAGWGSGVSGVGQSFKPQNIAIDGDGFLYITDSYGNNNPSIWKFSSDGVYISHWNFLDKVFFDDFLKRCSLTPRSPPDCWDDLHTFQGIAIGTDGNLYIVDQANSSIVITNHEGKYLNKWGSERVKNGQFGSLSDIAVDRDGNIFVTNYGNKAVLKFSADGTFLTSFGLRGVGDGQFRSPGGIGIDQKGFVYITDTELDRVQKFTGSGIYVTKWGTKGSKDGEFDEPSDVAVDSNGNVYVTDNLNDRIQKFTENGSFLLKWGSTHRLTAQQTSKSLESLLILDGPKTLAPYTQECEGITISNVSRYLTIMNGELHWGFSDEQIRQYPDKLQKKYEKKYKMGKDWISFCNRSEFSEDLRDTIGITEEQRLAYLYYYQNGKGNPMYAHHGEEGPETPHFVINGNVTDPEGRPVPDAVVRFESNLVIRKTQMRNWVDQDTPLSSTTRTGVDGTYHLDVVWGDQQNATVTKDGYLNSTRSGINLKNESNTIDFPLTPQPRQTASTPGFLFVPVVTAIMLARVIIVRKRY